MITQAEITTALTDLLMAAVLIPIIVLIAKIKTDKPRQKKWWLIFFIMLDAACILGFAAHFFCRSELSETIVWIPLYPLIYEVVNCFFLVALAIFSDDRRPKKKDIIIVHAISFFAYFATRVFVHYVDIHDIIPLTAFNTLVGIAGFVLIFLHAKKRENRRERLIFTALIPLLPGAYFQMSRDCLIHIIWDFNEDSITHMFFIVAMILLFFGVKRCLEKNK